jgi:hypothetical protein
METLPYVTTPFARAQNKAEALASMLKDVNPKVNIEYIIPPTTIEE